MYRLVPHPAHPPKAVDRVSADMWFDSDGLTLEFAMWGDLGLVEFDLGGGGSRIDGLWKETCFELFLKPAGSESYLEMNLAPSGDWAAYLFDFYRENMRNAAIALKGDPFLLCDGSIFETMANFTWGDSPPLGPGHLWQAGFSAVIVEEDGTRSYWALAHPPGAPDFHHPDCFVAQLPPAGEP